MKQLLTLLAVGLHLPLLAGDWAAPITATPTGGNTSDAQKWFGAPNINFGRGAADSDLPGYPLASLSYLHEFDADFDTRAGEVSSGELSLWTPIAPLNFGHLHVIAMLGYRMTEFDTSVDNLLSEDTLHTFRLPVVFLNDHSEDWIYGGMVMPAFSGDLSSSDNFFFSAALGAGRTFGPTLRIFGGIYYSDGFEDSTVIPGLAFIWRPSPRWEASLMGPIGSVNYSINERMFLSFVARYSAPTWNVEADASGPDRDIEYSSLRLGLKLERRFSERLWASVTGGVTLAREIDIEDRSNTTLQRDDLDPGPFVEVALTARF